MVEPNVDPTQGPDKASEDLTGEVADGVRATDDADAHTSVPAEKPTAPDAPDASGGTAADAADLDTDTEFARIVAGLDDVRAATDHVDVRRQSWLTDVPTLPGVHPIGPRDHAASEEEIALEDEQSHFVPPDPGPILGGDPVLTTAWFAVAAGILALVASALLVRVMPSVVAWIGAGLLAGGAGVLLWRLPHERGDSRGDDEPWV
ncbi:hypothetical protein [Sanguibacter sp. HDW7]|uniref:hypothetical protein n=1 Tax=Sanguibacter sp. HDW7 TaxID=2714931 RepID=UPI001409B3A0|nr:hypothetical protein [Sanguibacter sp. HDW7]QIK83699.1 hypothetical protein G7063_08730 [Sanguibacter sp. HDW7]